jgi:putative ABC transport system permease protein
MPDWTREIRVAIAKLEMGPAQEASLVEELSQHLTDRYEELRGNGVDDAESWALLSAELNDGTLVAALQPLLLPSPEAAPPGLDLRERLFAGVGNDLRQALRLLRFNPGFAGVAILSLALGIGANTAIFELIDAVLMRTLPVPSPLLLADMDDIQ